MITVLAEPGMIRVGALLALGSEEVHHLKVRRAASGDSIRLLDGRGTVGSGIVSVGRSEARVEVADARHFDPPVPLILGVGAGDKERFGWLVEKCAELGVSEIVPLVTERTVHVATRVRPEHIEKLSRRGYEAIKQSGNPFAPRVREPTRLEDLVETTGISMRLMAEQGGGPIGALLPDLAVTCVIGPEGGWDEKEIALLDDAGFRPVSLGVYTLRFETAAVAVVVGIGLARQSGSIGS